MNETATSRQKTNARAAARHARNTGKLTPLVHCEVCGPVPAVQMHHPDYSDPLGIIWLCRKCHTKAHIPAATKGSWIHRTRIGLRMSLRELAARAGVSVATVLRAENSTGVPNINARNLVRIKEALEAEGAEFADDGSVRLRRPAP